ncbi:hypothetical protein B0H63DRAFT_445265 [Podospora didyma]|uniref:CFEM domain-containing protein n=1 Tax=Podospora didyma TaxID=330526 RepID=A0AAE0P8B2_9PEZI|nr:hypothetical protein B0H63DRAFT_445265 [Podospora didyma]
MVALRSLALFIAAAVASGQTIDSLDPCGRDCYNGAVAEFAKLGCGANDMACLCGKQDFKFAVRDCAMNACPPGYANTVVNAANALCATDHPTGAYDSTSVVNAAASNLCSSHSDSAAQLERRKLGASSREYHKLKLKQLLGYLHYPSGLSTPAKIGIGAGAVLAVAALVVVGVWAIVRRSRKGRKGPGSMRTPIKISEPMPGAGRSYAHDHHYEAGLSELEMKSRPYEEMVPRQKPRHMV